MFCNEIHDFRTFQNQNAPHICTWLLRFGLFFGGESCAIILLFRIFKLIPFKHESQSSRALSAFKKWIYSLSPQKKTTDQQRKKRRRKGESIWENKRKNFFFVFVNLPLTFFSCCRLLNDSFTKIAIHDLNRCHTSSCLFSLVNYSIHRFIVEQLKETVDAVPIHCTFNHFFTAFCFKNTIFMVFHKIFNVFLRFWFKFFFFSWEVNRFHLFCFVLLNIFFRRSYRIGCFFWIHHHCRHK